MNGHRGSYDVFPVDGHRLALDASTKRLLVELALPKDKPADDLRTRQRDVYESWRSAIVSNDVSAIGSLVQAAHALRDLGKLSAPHSPAESLER